MEIETTRSGTNKLFTALKMLLKDTSAVATLSADEDSDFVQVRGSSSTAYIETEFLAEIIEPGTINVTITDLLTNLPKGQTLTIAIDGQTINLTTSEASATLTQVEDHTPPARPIVETLAKGTRKGFLSAITAAHACVGVASTGPGFQSIELSVDTTSATFTSSNRFIAHVHHVPLTDVTDKAEAGFSIPGNLWSKAINLDTSSSTLKIISTSDRRWVGVEMGSTLALFPNEGTNLGVIRKAVSQTIDDGFVASATYPSKEVLAAINKNKKAPLVAVQYNEQRNARLLFKDSDKQPISIDSKGTEGVRSFVVTPANLTKITQTLDGEEGTLHFPANKFRPILVTAKGKEPSEENTLGVIMTVDTKGERTKS